MPRTPIPFRTRILRRQDGLPRYVVLSPDLLPGRSTAFPAEVMLNAAGPFSRNIHLWGKGVDVFFFNLTAVQCRRAGLVTGDECQITVTPLD